MQEEVFKMIDNLLLCEKIPEVTVVSSIWDDGFWYEVSLSWGAIKDNVSVDVEVEGTFMGTAEDQGEVVELVETYLVGISERWE